MAEGDSPRGPSDEIIGRRQELMDPDDDLIGRRLERRWLRIEFFLGLYVAIMWAVGLCFVPIFPILVAFHMALSFIGNNISAISENTNVNTDEDGSGFPAGLIIPSLLIGIPSLYFMVSKVVFPEWPGGDSPIKSFGVVLVALYASIFHTALFLTGAVGCVWFFPQWFGHACVSDCMARNNTFPNFSYCFWTNCTNWWTIGPFTGIFLTSFLHFVVSNVLALSLCVGLGATVQLCVTHAQNMLSTPSNQSLWRATASRNT